MITTSFDALMLIFPDPSIVMSFPLMVMVPSFFIVKLALPVVMDTESAAVITRFLPTLNLSSSPTDVVRAFATLVAFACAYTLYDFVDPAARDMGRQKLRAFGRR